MLEAPQRAGATESGLHFVEHQQRAVALAPLAQAFGIGRRREGGRAALVGLHEHAGHVGGVDARIPQAALEQVEGGVLGPEAVGKGHLHEARVEIDDPFLQRWDAARLLRAHGAAMESFLEGDDDVLTAPAVADAPGTAQLDRAFDGFRAGGQQEHFLERLRQQPGEPLDQLCALQVGEAVAGEQTLGGLAADGVADFLAAVAGVRDQHARGPVDPAVAESVVNLEARGMIPQDRRLAAHGQRFPTRQRFEYRQRAGGRNLGLNAPQWRVDVRNAFRCEVVIFSHVFQLPDVFVICLRRAVLLAQSPS